MHLNKERGEIIFGNEDIFKMMIPMMEGIIEKCREAHDEHIVIKTIFIPMEEMRLLGLKVRAK